MNTKNYDAYISYSSRDREEVHSIARILESEGLNVWIDTQSLLAGDRWADEIQKGISSAKSFLALISPSYLESTELLREFMIAYQLGKLIIPVVITPIDHDKLPDFFSALIITDYSPSALPQIIAQIRNVEDEFVPSETTAEISQYAEELAAKKGGHRRLDIDETDNSNSVFVVHGHDEAMLRDVESYLNEIGVRPVIMKDVGDDSISLLQKFLQISGEAQYAIVLVSGDDLGGMKAKVSRFGIGKWALKLRARQNVILELGYFFGLLGWERVFVLQKSDTEEFRDFEIPSDLSGVPFVSYDRTEQWRRRIRKKLEQHDFRLNI